MESVLQHCFAIPHEKTADILIVKVLNFCREALQSSQVKRTPQDPINEFIIWNLNLFVVVDFRFISAFLHV